MRIALSLGSNMGNKEKHLKRAISLLPGAGITHIKTSKFIITSPWGTSKGDNYLNCVVIGKMSLSPITTWKNLAWIESSGGRKRTEVGAPRTIDIDIVLMGSLTSDLEMLIVPHPRMHLRSFVIQPLLELLPEGIHPLLKSSFQSMEETF